MELKVLLFLWLCSGPVQSSIIRGFLEYSSQPRTWEQAQQNCRSNGGDLATVVTEADLKDLDMNKFHAWIGLKKNVTWLVRKVNRWDAFTTNQFAADEPDDGEKCGKLIYSENKAYGDFCYKKLFVFCEEAGKHYFIPETKSWAEGEALCEKKNLRYMDFRPGHSKRLRDFPVWIGLQRHGDGWSWSDGTVSDFSNWTSGSDFGFMSGLGSGSALNPTPGDCVAVSSQHRSMFNVSCSEAFPSVCYRHNVVLLQKNLSWEEALKSCENMTNSYSHSSFSLLSLEENEQHYVKSHAHSATTSKVWVGLRFLAGSWFWSDGVPVSLSLPSCPEVHCGALDLNTSSIEPTDCREKLNLLCYGSGPQWS